MVDLMALCKSNNNEGYNVLRRMMLFMKGRSAEAELFELIECFLQYLLNVCNNHVGLSLLMKQLPILYISRQQKKVRFSGILNVVYDHMDMFCHELVQ